MKKNPLRKIVLFCIVSMISTKGFSQKTKDTVYVNYESVNDLLDKTQRAEVTLHLFRNEQFGYEVNIPAWLALKETGESNFFGGTFPAVKGVENALLVTAFSNERFKSFDEFEYIYLTGNKFGKPTLFDREHTWYGQNELKKIPHGVEQRIFMIWNNKVYHCKFVLLETPKAYLWVQFTSTPGTYDENLPKFDDFVAGIKMLE